jgi:glycosyltransferase involved in cell wall biosynthesis
MTDTRQGVSILIATYNGAAYIDEQLKSIVMQASSNDEIVIMDDSSSDNSVAIIAHYASNHPNIRLVRNERNVGVRATFERLLGAATKNIVILSDQDDIWIDGRRDRMVESLRHDGCVAVLANALVLTERGVERTFFSEAQPPNVTSLTQNFVRNNFIGCCMAFRREVLNLALPFPRSISMHDWWLGSCAIALGNVRYIAVPLLLYRRHSNNQSASRRRSWRVVAKDRGGNLRALGALLARTARLRRSQNKLRY